MLSLRLLLTLTLSALALAAPPALLPSRQDVDCQAEYGPYEPYTGSCSDTNCGARGTDCTKRGQMCAPYPCKFVFFHSMILLKISRILGIFHL
jgi:hypothetical protein